MKRIASFLLLITVGLAFTTPVSTFAQQPTPTPKYKGKGGGGPPQGVPGGKSQGGKPQFGQQQQQFVHKPVVTSTPAASHTPFSKTVTQKPVINKNVALPTPPPKFTGGNGKPLYHKPAGNGSNPAVNPAIVNQTNVNQANGNPKFKKGNGGKPAGNPGNAHVVNNTAIVSGNTHVIPKLKQAKSWAGPKWKGGGGGGQQFNRANNYGGHWVEASAHSDWDRRQEHDWDGHHFRWFNGGWLIIDNGFWPQGYYQYQLGGSKIYNAQAELADMGYYNGDVDGIVGPLTRQAIADFQADNGLPVDGHLNPPTQDALGL